MPQNRYKNKYLKDEVKYTEIRMIYYLFLHIKDLPGTRRLTSGHGTNARADVPVIFRGDMVLGVS